jgi:MHS family proline/betaine transporter-like MFS transporter
MADSTKAANPVTNLTGRQTVLAAAASVFGWGLDLFDLLILLYVAPIIGRLFFPTGNPMMSLAAT